MQSHRADVRPCVGAKSLGMGLENIDEQLHSSFLIVGFLLVRKCVPLGKSSILIGNSS
jgi:hypothetical protein